MPLAAELCLFCCCARQLSRPLGAAAHASLSLRRLASGVPRLELLLASPSARRSAGGGSERESAQCASCSLTWVSGAGAELDVVVAARGWALRARTSRGCVFAEAACGALRRD